jgi:hypothetical protein
VIPMSNLCRLRVWAQRVALRAHQGFYARWGLSHSSVPSRLRYDVTANPFYLDHKLLRPACLPQAGLFFAIKHFCMNLSQGDQWLHEIRTASD